jgi:molybdopterin molybdotransferase
MAMKLIEVEEARRSVLERAASLASEQVALADALGRVLAEEVRSTAAVPPFDSSAMDGFALRHGDVRAADEQRPVTLRVVGESRAGHPALGILEGGEAIAISTGAAMPAGADAVVAVEQTRLHDGHVEILAEAAVHANVRFAGEDIGAGVPALALGCTLGAAELGVLASLGLARVSCVRRPRVSVITTGDELTEPGQPLRPGTIYNSNAPSVSALATLAGAELRACASVGDSLRETSEALASAFGHADVVVLCGGVSVGTHDHVRPALAELGAEERFWGVALKPGKPTLFATRGETLAFGLPGNPVSAMVTFALFVAPALRALGGSSSVRRRTTATLTRDHIKAPGRAHAVRCRLLLSDEGWRAEPTGDQGSHVLTSMLGADALAIIPTESGCVAAGTRVEIELLDGAPGMFA